MGWPFLLFLATLSVTGGLFSLWALRRGELSGRGTGLKNAFRQAWIMLIAVGAMISYLIGFWGTWSEGQRVFAGVATGLCLLPAAILIRHAFAEKRRFQVAAEAQEEDRRIESTIAVIRDR